MQVQEKGENTAKLCRNVVEGTKSNEANAEYIGLYTYDFKGVCVVCTSFEKNSENEAVREIVSG